MDPLLRLKFAIASAFFVCVFGTLGYLALGWPLLDAVYMTLLTVTTVGYREVGVMTTPAILFTMALMVVGVGTVLYSFGALIEMAVAGQIQELWGGKRMQGRIDKLENHYIICGFGRMGQVVCQELAEDNLPFCVIDRGAEALREAKQKDYLCVYGESSDEDVLRRAGLDRAKALVACVSTDADNLFLILTARELNPGLQIIARAADAKSEPKLLRAGANRVVAPYMIGGQRIAQALLKPSVVDFIEIAAKRRRMDLIMEEATVEVGSPLAGKSIKEAAIRQTMGLIIVAVKPSNGDMKFNPKATLRIAGGDVLIALGEKKELTKLEDACRAG